MLTLLNFSSSTFAQASATAVGHWPWFTVYNYMNKHMPWDDGAFRMHGYHMLLLYIGDSAVFSF
jgi:hypothetical protein